MASRNSSSVPKGSARSVDEQRGRAQVGEKGGALLVGLAGRMQRIREQQQAGGQARGARRPAWRFAGRRRNARRRRRAPSPGCRRASAACAMPCAVARRCAGNGGPLGRSRAEWQVVAQHQAAGVRRSHAPRAPAAWRWAFEPAPWVSDQRIAGGVLGPVQRAANAIGFEGLSMGRNLWDRRSFFVVCQVRGLVGQTIVPRRLPAPGPTPQSTDNGRLSTRALRTTIFPRQPEPRSVADHTAPLLQPPALFLLLQRGVVPG